MTAQPQLFDLPPIPGLVYREALIDLAEEAALVERLLALDLPQFRFQRWTGKRRTASFGWRYDFEDSSFAPSDPIPDWLIPLRDKAARFAGLAEDDLGHALVARYDPGAGIGWHRDRPVFDRVIGISLASPAVLRFRRRTDAGFRRFGLEVAPRSAYILSGEARREWEHSIVPGEALRLSVTFRTLA